MGNKGTTNNRENESNCNKNTISIPYKKTSKQQIIGDNKITSESNDKNNEDSLSKLTILSMFMSSNKQNDPYIHRYLAYGDDDYGCVTHFNSCNKRKVFIGNFQCFAYDEAYNKYFSWGLNNYGQLAQGEATNYMNKNTSKYHFINTFGEAKLFKEGLKQLIKIEKMSFGDGFTIASDNTSTIYSWGLCEDYQLGIELKFNEINLVNGKKCKLHPIKVFQSSSKITSLESGKDFSFIINADKHVYAWGSNNEQQILPHCYTDKKNKPRNYYYKKVSYIEELSDMSLVEIKLGWSHAIASCKNYNHNNIQENINKDEIIIDTDNNDYTFNSNRVFVWGKIDDVVEYNDFTELNFENENPISIESGISHCLVLTGLNNVFSIGDNSYGQCGFNNKEISKINQAKKISTTFKLPEEVIYTIKCGANYSMLLIYSSGWKQYEITVFGHNFNREIGNYDKDIISNPVRFGYNLYEPKLRISDVLLGNGITVIKFSNDKRLVDYRNDGNQTIEEDIDHLITSQNNIIMKDIDSNQV